MNDDDLLHAMRRLERETGITMAQRSLFAEVVGRLIDAQKERVALVAAHEYLDSSLRPCEIDCECILHDLEDALRLKSTKGVK